MITCNSIGDTNRPIRSFMGLSSDKKPIEWYGVRVPQGSTFYEIDTTTVYIFDLSTLSWIKQLSGGSSGGGSGEAGVGVQSVEVNNNNHLIITYTDGSVADAGEITIEKVASTKLYTPLQELTLIDGGDADGDSRN